MKKRIMLYGDSNTWGHNPEKYPETIPYFARYDKEDRLAGQMAQYLPDCEIIEEGLCGRNTCLNDASAPYLNGDLYFEACMHTNVPLDMVIIMLGTNDLQACFSFPPSYSAKALEKYIKTVQHSIFTKREKPIEILLVSPIHVGEHVFDCILGGCMRKTSVEESKEFAPLYEAVANKMGCRFLDAAKYAQPCKEDGIHMDKENIAKLAKAFADEVKKAIY